MPDRKALQAEMISGHSGPSPGLGMQRDLEVCKLVDTTTCIGCKACEVACVEWNDLPFSPTTFDNTYQTMPETRWNFWNLIKFNEHQNPDGTIQWLMRKDQCMHCADPGCLAACPADGAIVKYANGIVDFNQENCIGCEFCVSGCPFNIPRFNPDDQASVQVHALLRPRRRGSRTRMHQSLSHRLSEVRHKRRHEIHRRGARQTTEGKFRLAERRRLRSAIGRRNPRDLRTPRRHRSRALRQPAQESADPVELHRVEVALQARARNLRLFGFLGVLAALRDLRPAPDPTGTPGKGWRQWQRLAVRSDVSTTRLARVSNTWAKPPSIAESCCAIRSTRACSTGSVALFFFLALFTGFSFYLPWLFRWFTPIFGGGPLSRVMHPWFGVGFVFFFGLQALNWLRPMIWTAADSKWMRNMGKIVSGEEKMDPPDTGFFNAGQKIQFWEIVGGCIVVPHHRHHPVGGRENFRQNRRRHQLRPARHLRPHHARRNLHPHL